MFRNWTNEETVLFCQILTDPVCNYLETLEKKALKKSSTKEVFESILEDFQKSLQNHEFIERNGNNFSSKKKKSEIVFDVKRLQQKYNNLKQKWRQRSDQKKNGSGLASSEDPEWYTILDPVLTDTNTGLDVICSDPAETSFVKNQNEEDGSEEDDDSNISSEDETTPHTQNKEQNPGPATETTPSVRKKVIAKPHEKRGHVRSQVQAIAQLAAGVNKLAEVSAKRMKSEEKDREVLLQFRREGSEKNRNHEKEMAQLYLMMMNQPTTPFAAQHQNATLPYFNPF